jgi:D-alanyl-D-alanine carboxypeptidase
MTPAQSLPGPVDKECLVHRFIAQTAAVAATLTLLGATGSVARATPSPESPAVRAAIDAIVARDRTVYGGKTPLPAVLVGVWDAQGRSYVRAYGYANLAKKTPLSPDDHFRIGSNTKTFVVSVILQLVDEGKMKLDDPLSTFHIGVKVPNAQHITVRQMAEMRSGLFEVFNVPQLAAADAVKPTSTFDPHTLVRWAVAQKPYFAPGKDYNYSNTNYLLLGLIIEAVTHDSVSNEIRKRLLDHYALNDTSYPATMAMPEPWAHGYGLDAKKNWEDVSNTIPVTLMGAAGEMISTMADMKRWMTMYVAGGAESPSMQKAKLDCIYTGEGNLSFGLGIGCSAGWYGYTGGLPGYNTANYYFPKANVFITSWVSAQINAPRPGAANAVFHDIARIMTPNNIPFASSDKSTGKSGL